ncbi:MAG: 5'-nucleotidase C-terminal domain-containing protein [Deltaproteobacteria bacterium]|nr:5'-nucleotidase C-terminal domain-containing protein [Deltaproteobacteria bacterium]
MLKGWPADGSWLIDGKPLNKEANYKVAISGFLLRDKEGGGFFSASNNPVIALMEGMEKYEMRQLVIDYLKH